MVFRNIVILLEVWSGPTLLLDDKYIQIFIFRYSNEEKFEVVGSYTYKDEKLKLNHLPVTTFTIRNMIFMATFNTIIDQNNKTEEIDFYKFDPSRYSMEILQKIKHYSGPIVSQDNFDSQIMAMPFYK